MISYFANIKFLKNVLPVPLGESKKNLYPPLLLTHENIMLYKFFYLGIKRHFYLCLITTGGNICVMSQAYDILPCIYGNG